MDDGWGLFDRWLYTEVEDDANKEKGGWVVRGTVKAGRIHQVVFRQKAELKSVSVGKSDELKLRKCQAPSLTRNESTSIYAVYE